jgi:hypothetical protein
MKPRDLIELNAKSVMYDWDLLDDDCSSLAGWSDLDDGDASTTQVTEEEEIVIGTC